MTQRWMFDDLGDTLAERTGVCSTIAMSGFTFTRSLMPRTVMGQALATGLYASLSYGLTTSTQSLLWSTARLVAGGLLPQGTDPMTAGGTQTAGQERVTRVVVHTLNLSAIGAGSVIEGMFAQRDGERLVRAAARTTGTRVKRTAMAGALTALVLDASEILGPRLRIPPRITSSAIPGILASAAVAAGIVYFKRRQAARLGPTRGFVATSAPAPRPDDDASTPAALEPTPAENARSSAIMSMGAGIGTSIALVALGKGEGLLARGVSAVLRPIMPSHPEIRLTFGHGVGMGVLGAGVVYAIDRVYRSTERAGDAVESAYDSPPTVPGASGGPNSGVDWATLSREGRRFVNMTLTAHDIETVMAEPAKDPIRAFVGLETAATPQERAELLVAELERLGAFERRYLCFASPTGTGYVNYVLTEALEYLTRGDIATAAIQYSLRPSFLSLDRVRIGRENNLAFLTLLHRRLAEIPFDQRPHLLLFGESLGAHTSQDAFLHQGAEGLHRVGVERALFIGTPDGSKWARNWRARPEITDPDREVVEVASIREWHALPPERRASARWVLLSHHEDPITKFGPEIAIQRPRWLPSGGVRPPGVPPEMIWLPFLTMFVTVADVLNAMHVVPGVFGALGHDYRADLADFAIEVFGLPADDAQRSRMDLALRARERFWAERQVVSEQLDKARAKVQTTMAGWNVPGSELLDRVTSLPAADPITGVIAHTGAEVPVRAAVVPAGSAG